MKRNVLLLWSSLLGMLLPGSASALCRGASVQPEYREAEWVVRARVVSAINRYDDNPGAAYRRLWGDGGPVVRYVLRVQDSYKGRPPREIVFFQERNSGAFYMDRGMKPDIGGSYLLFLNRIPAYPGKPGMARDAMQVRHSCGQSKAWPEVRAKDLAALTRLAGRSRG
jgi:hypothetical protein